MKKQHKISNAVLRRLPKYYRYLEDLKEKDIKRISSYELSKLTGFTASQIRQDFNNFGGFGQQGYGYNTIELHKNLGKILGLNEGNNVIIIGFGNLGQAIANYKNFEKYGFKVIKIFEKNPEFEGKKVGDIEIGNIDSLENFVQENKVDIGVITTPREAAQENVDRLIESGVMTIWNFAPVDLEVPKEAVVENVHLSESLLALSYLMNEKKQEVEE